MNQRELPYTATWENGFSVLRNMNAPEGSQIMGMYPEDMGWVAERLNAAFEAGRLLSKEVVEAGRAQTKIIRKAQAILASHLPPDGISQNLCISRLLGLLDGPDQREAQHAWDAALSSAKALDFEPKKS